MLRKAKSVKGVLHQVKRCEDCRTQPSVLYDNGIGICLRHFNLYNEKLNYENKTFSWIE